MEFGSLTVIGAPAAPLARVIGVIVFAVKLATQAVAQSGVMAIDCGPPPTVMGVPGVFEETVIAVTLLEA